MVIVHTREDSGRHVLKVFRKNNMEVGNVLRARRFTLPFTTTPWQASDFKTGIEKAIHEGWIEAVSPTEFRLTQAGFDET